MEHVDLSIIMVCYNHEKFVEKAIRSIVNQKTRYRYELLVGDDASEDSTPDIIIGLSEEFPDILVPVLRKENVGGTRNSYELLSRARGEYIAFCDGDDEWIVGNRIDRQIDFLKNNNQYSAICGRCNIIDNKGEVVDDSKVPIHEFWNYHDSEYGLSDFEMWKMPGHDSAILGKNFYRTGDCSVLWRANRIVGDRSIALLFLEDGLIFCSDDTVSNYRLGTDGDNFVAKYRKQNLRFEDYQMMENLEELMLETRGTRIDLDRCKKQRFIGSVVIWMEEKNDSNKAVMKKIISAADNKLEYRVLFLKTLILKQIYWKILKTDKNIKY